MIEIYCDGACSNNPGSGSWGYIVYKNGEQISLACGVSLNTTNNIMELTAVIKALEVFDDIQIYTDSSYVYNGSTNWVYKWSKNNWKTEAGIVKNKELWIYLLNLLNNKKVKWNLVKGHSGGIHDEVDNLVQNFKIV